MVEKITSCRTSGSSSSSSGGSDVVNEVKLVYNDFGQLTADCQEHAGAVSLSTTPKVQYLYADGSAGHNRLEKLLYPNGRGLVHGYHSGADDAINRVSYLADESGSTAGMHLAEYAYLGLGGIVQVDYSEPDIRCDLAHGTGNDPYAGLDRFDRVVDLLWRNYGTSADAVRIQHGYDRAGNRLWREDPVAAAHGVNLDELYSYDGVYQLTHRDRGDLNANRNAVTSKNFAEDWTLDMTGNWPAFKQDSDGDGTWDLNQSRTHDMANEIAQIAGSSTHVAHDRAGNMTRIPQPGDWSAHFELVFDAWNRLVKLVDGQTIVAEYTYDGRNFRVTKTISGTVRHFYYSASWQVLEDRVESSVERQNVWGLRYVDDLVLRDRDADANTETGSLGLTGSGLEERLYALQNPNWNVAAIASSDGAIAERYAFTAYGKPTFLSAAFANPTTSSSYSWDTLYTGRQFDPEAGLYYYRHRFYGSELSRFVSRDPLEYRAGDSNLYEYVGDNPTNATDPTGLQQAVKTFTLFVCVRPIVGVAVGGHVFIILDCGTGPWVFRGGPSDGHSRGGCKCKNQLVADSYPYQLSPNVQDTPPDIPRPGDPQNTSCRKYPIRTAADCEAIRNCFNKTIALINKQCLEYKAVPGPVDTGTNSNAVASWLLQKCMKNPPLLLPGGKVLTGWPTFLPGFIKNPQPDNKVSKCCGGDGSSNG